MNVTMQFENFLYPMDLALRILKAKYQNDIEDMFVDLPILKNNFEDFIREIWDEIKPITMIDLMSPDSEVFANTKTDDIGDKRRSLFRFLPMSMMFDQEGQVMDTQTVTTKQLDGTIDNVYRLKRVSIKKVFPEMREPVFNDKRITYLWAVEVTDTHTGKRYHIQVPGDEPFCKKGKYDAAAAVAWLCYVRIPVNYIESIARQGEVHTFKIKPECVGKPWHIEAYHMSKQDYFNLLNQQA